MVKTLVFWLETLAFSSAPSERHYAIFNAMHGKAPPIVNGGDKSFTLTLNSAACDGGADRRLLITDCRAEKSYPRPSATAAHSLP
jgi:hypothetical protein